MAKQTKTHLTDKLRERAHDVYESSKEKLESAKDRTQDYIQKNPFTSVAIAAGVGALLGAAITLGVQRALPAHKRPFWHRISDWF